MQQDNRVKIDQKANQALLTYAYQQLHFSQLATFFCATIALAGLWQISNLQMALISWYGISLVVIVLRLITQKIYLQKAQSGKKFVLWQLLFFIGVVLSGLCWSAIIIAFFPHMNNWQQILCVVIIAGMSSAGLITLAAQLRAAILFVLLLMCPLIVQMMFYTVVIHQIFDFALIFYLVFLVLLAFRMHEVINNVIHLQFENEALLQNLEYLATHDQLTQIDNRSLFSSNLVSAIKRADRDKKLLALLFIDLDNFKNINDVYGHDVGDRVLQEVVGRIKNTLRKTDFVARLGGDEFVIILEQISSSHYAASVAKKIQVAIAEPLKATKNESSILASIGISIYPNDGTNLTGLLNASDKAMYFVKNHGGNSFHFASQDFPK
ncbi:MAG: GGDEF domain-containing protein [Gammaproteobacteria bacterium]|nr:GGDEF domain-containing protein [Gammaproteobacteria bacterium]